MEKLDLKNQLKPYYTVSTRTPVLITVPTFHYFVIAGRGTPEGEDFQTGAKAIFTLAYVLKFMVREKLAIDYPVMPLEAQWTVNRHVKGDFRWTMMVLQPDLITPELVEAARCQAAKKVETAHLERDRLETITEGPCVQMMHAGPYEGMNATLEKMRLYAESQGYDSAPDTHDIYLNDVRRTKPENLRTLMRVTVQPKKG